MPARCSIPPKACRRSTRPTVRARLRAARHDRSLRDARHEDASKDAISRSNEHGRAEHGGHRQRERRRALLAGAERRRPAHQAGRSRVAESLADHRRRRRRSQPARAFRATRRRIRICICRSTNRARAFAVLVRTDGDPSSLAGPRERCCAHQSAARRLQRAAASELVDTQLAAARFLSWLTGTFAAVALTLALIGIYGTLSVLGAPADGGDRHSRGARRQPRRACLGWSSARR